MWYEPHFYLDATKKLYAMQPISSEQCPKHNSSAFTISQKADHTSRIKPLSQSHLFPVQTVEALPTHVCAMMSAEEVMKNVVRERERGHWKADAFPMGPPGIPALPAVQTYMWVLTNFSATISSSYDPSITLRIWNPRAEITTLESRYNFTDSTTKMCTPNEASIVPKSIVIDLTRNTSTMLKGDSEELCNNESCTEWQLIFQL